MAGKKKTLHTVLQRAICLALSVTLVAGLSLAPAFASEPKGGSGFDGVGQVQRSAVNGAVAQDAVQGGLADDQDASNSVGNGTSVGGADAAKGDEAGAGASTGNGESAGQGGDKASATEQGKDLSLAAAAQRAKDAAQKDAAEKEEADEPSEDELAPLTQDVSAEWPNFRGNAYNNGIVNFDIPTSAEESQLLWAKKMGEGWSNAVSTQLIVDGCIVFMANTTIYKVNMSSGAIVAQGTMCDKFNWGYTPFAYGEGKIFVSLASGKVQAFDATTLESLWVYTDPLGGQSVSPVVYSDGYVYTGFWKSEKKDANYVCLKAEDEDRTQATEAKEATWTMVNKGGFYWAGALAAGNYLVFGCDDGITAETGGTSTLRCVNKYDGKVVSTLELSGLGDQRSALCYTPELGKIFFTTKSGYICSASFSASSGQLSNLSSSHVWEGAASTSTPVYYKGKLYFGVGAAFDGGSHCRFVVADASTLKTIGSAEAWGDVKSSPLLSTATEDSGYLSFYFTCNRKPGGIYVAKVNNDCSSDSDIEISEIYDAAGLEEYCITSIIASSDGTMYYKNDSGHVFAVGFSADGRTAAQQRHATAFQEKVDALFPVTIGNADAIAAARAAERGLSSAVRALVPPETFGKLTQAEEDLAQLQADKQVADEFTAAVDALFPVTAESGNAIAAARAMHDALTPGQLAFVSQETIGNLSRAETEYQAFLVDDESIKQIIKAVSALFPVSIESGEAIDAVQDMFDALNVLQMEKVPVEVRNSYKLAKQQYRKICDNKLAADAFVETLLGAFPITLESGDALKQARAAYDALTSDQLGYLPEFALEKLQGAEAEYQKLVDDKAAVDRFTAMVKALFPVTKDSEGAIAAADKALAAMTDDQRAQVAKETLKDLQKAKDEFAALNKTDSDDPSDKSESDDSNGNPQAGASAGTATKSLSGSKAATSSAKDGDSAAADDEVAYTALLTDDGATTYALGTEETASKLPWLEILIAAVAFFAGAGITRLVSSGKGSDKEE